MTKVKELLAKTLSLPLVAITMGSLGSAAAEKSFDQECCFDILGSKLKLSKAISAKENMKFKK